MKFKTILLIVFFYTINISSQQTVKTIINTSEGIIKVELYSDKAPVTVANFLEYVSNNLYNNTSFFRVCTPNNEADRTIKIEVIQGGDIPKELLFPPIQLETTKQTGIKHLSGTISMARDTPNSAQSSFFICINNQPELDYKGKRNPDGQGFAAFGKVIEGMDVVLKIQSLNNKNQLLLNPVEIFSITKTN
jgi:peptidyl-prolyl cis-trans isomerase A (cyclophilin A)